jgi:hypothetical protein
MNLLQSVEKFFGIGQAATTIATGGEAAYQALLKDEQDAAAWVSGALAVINQNTTIDATLVAPIIAFVFPNVDPSAIETTLISLASTIQTDQSKIPTTLPGAIAIIQAYLAPKVGNPWITAVQGLFSLGATLASPVTPIQKFVAAGEYVYLDIVSPLLGLHKSTVSTATSAPVQVTPAIAAPTIAAPPVPAATPETIPGNAQS